MLLNVPYLRLFGSSVGIEVRVNIWRRHTPSLAIQSLRNITVDDGIKLDVSNRCMLPKVWLGEEVSVKVLDTMCSEILTRPSHVKNFPLSMTFLLSITRSMFLTDSSALMMPSTSQPTSILSMSLKLVSSSNFFQFHLHHYANVPT